MRFSLVLLLLVFASWTPFAKAQDEQQDLRTLLQDSAYVFNRYQEATIGLDAQIDDWNIPIDAKQLFKQTLATSLRNVNQEKPMLNELLLRREISSTELFDLYSELTELYGEMNEESSNTANWGDSSTGVQLAQLGAKTGVLSANIGNILRARIETQESQLETCMSKLPAATPKHK